MALPGTPCGDRKVSLSYLYNLLIKQLQITKLLGLSLDTQELIRDILVIFCHRVH